MESFIKLHNEQAESYNKINVESFTNSEIIDAILTTLTRDIQCEKFIEDESVSHEPCDSMYPNVS